MSTHICRTCGLPSAFADPVHVSDVHHRGSLGGPDEAEDEYLDGPEDGDAAANGERVVPHYFRWEPDTGGSCRYCGLKVGASCHMEEEF